MNASSEMCYDPLNFCLTLSAVAVLSENICHVASFELYGVGQGCVNVGKTYCVLMCQKCRAVCFFRPILFSLILMTCIVARDDCLVLCVCLPWNGESCGLGEVQSPNGRIVFCEEAPWLESREKLGRWGILILCGCCLPSSRVICVFDAVDHRRVMVFRSPFLQ